MRAYRSFIAGCAIIAAIAVSGLVGAGQQVPMPPNTPRPPMAPTTNSGMSVTPGLEGWFRNADGTSTILIGYMNRNQDQVLDIPIGPNNHIDPGGPDLGQPTHFDKGREYGVFSITVPKDFGTKRYVWTLVANGQTQSITLWLNPPYNVSPYLRADNGNTPPIVKLDPAGPEITGPTMKIEKTLAAAVGEPLPLTVWATDTGNTISQETGGQLTAQDRAAAAGPAAAPPPAAGVF
jgi:hypothetical protein